MWGRILRCFIRKDAVVWHHPVVVFTDMEMDYEIETTPVAGLNHHPLNPREGDIGAIVQSIEANGWFGVVVAQRDTNEILVGNHRVKAARFLGIEEVPVQWVDVDEATQKRILLADNRTSDIASYNVHSLLNLLQDLPEAELSGTGYDGDDIDELIKQAPLPPMDFLDPPITSRSCPSCGYRWEMTYAKKE